jgi:hypothetical protein
MGLVASVLCRTAVPLKEALARGWGFSSRKVR